MVHFLCTQFHADIIQDINIKLRYNKFKKGVFLLSNITRIAITGGPCAGKTTGISTLEQELTEKGYRVFVVPEAATLFINSGAAPWIISGDLFQEALVKFQVANNKIFDEIAEYCAKTENKPVVIVYDRGIMDGRAYVDPMSDFDKMLRKNNYPVNTCRDYYDGVFHLVTAAKGAEEFYTTENNSARTESPEEAIIKDNRTLVAWTGHPHVRIISNDSKKFKEKIQKLLKEIYMLLGIPVPIETERKYLIEFPNIEEIKTKYNATKVQIIQTYLKSSDPLVERRIRQRGNDGEYTYYYTEKKTINDISREETERKISESEYLDHMMSADTTLKQIRKDRYCFVYEAQYFELDVYPFWEDKAIVEIELTEESQTVTFPPEIKIIKEVTADPCYKNRGLAESV